MFLCSTIAARRTAHTHTHEQTNKQTRKETSKKKEENTNPIGDWTSFELGTCNQRVADGLSSRDEERNETKIRLWWTVF